MTPFNPSGSFVKTYVIENDDQRDRSAVRTRRFFCVHCGLTRRRPGGIYCCCLPNEEMIRKNKNPYRCPQCHLSYTD